YVYEVVQEAFHGSIGLAAAVLTVFVNMYARKRVAACVGPSLTFKFWLYLPAILFLVVPIAVKVAVYLAGNGDRSFWDHLFSLLPLFLKLGVPAGTLLWAYIVIGKLSAPEGVEPMRYPTARVAPPRR
ncbi:MAG: hypothetical protein V3W34_04675, partial [Phycisphaerae bacterium]